jgi:hypothetical protein
MLLLFGEGLCKPGFVRREVLPWGGFRWAFIFSLFSRIKTNC